MFDLVLCDETNRFLREVRKELKNKGYNKTISKTNRKLGYMQINYITEYYTRKNTNIMFEIERDLTENVVSAKINYYDDNGRLQFKNIRLASIKDLC